MPNSLHYNSAGSYTKGTRPSLTTNCQQQRQYSGVATSAVLQPTFGPGLNPWGRQLRITATLVLSDIHWTERINKRNKVI